MRIGTVVEFEAAHRQLGDSGKCGFLHGHNWKADVNIKARGITELGYVVDFKEIKDYATHYDHVVLLKSGDPLIDVLQNAKQKVMVLPANPTCEVIAQQFARDIYDIVAKKVACQKVFVTIMENDRSWGYAAYPLSLNEMSDHSWGR